MKEVTAIYTLEITDINKLTCGEIDVLFTKEFKESLKQYVKAKLNVDDANIVDLKIFVRDMENDNETSII